MTMSLSLLCFLLFFARIFVIETSATILSETDFLPETCVLRVRQGCTVHLKLKVSVDETSPVGSKGEVVMNSGDDGNPATFVLNKEAHDVVFLGFYENLMGACKGERRILTVSDGRFHAPHFETIGLKDAIFKVEYEVIDITKEKTAFEHYDGNEDGKVSFDELLKVSQKDSSGPTEAEVRQIFETHDVNKDGFISPDEIQAKTYQSDL